MPEELVPIATFVTAAEAAAAKVALEAEGIECSLKDENVVGIYSIAAGALGYIKLLVRAEDADRARNSLATPFRDWPSFSTARPWHCRQCGEETEERLERCRHCGAPRRLSQPPSAGSPEEAGFIRALLQTDREEAGRQADNPYAPPRTTEQDLETADEDDRLGDATGHARCAGCGRPRVAVCPFCKTSGSWFPPADRIETEGAPHLLICPICDEPFEPTYLRTCEWCGHDAGEGIEAPEIVRPLPSQSWNWRVALVGLAGAATIAGLVVYFARLLS